MTSASHGFKTLRSSGIASKRHRRESPRVVTRVWGSARGLVPRLRERSCPRHLEPLLKVRNLRRLTKVQREVRFGGTPKPARCKRALPGLDPD